MRITSKIIQADLEDIRSLEIEEQNNFIFYILSTAGVPDDRIEPCIPVESNEMTTEQRILFRKLCSEYNLSVINDQDGGYRIYVGNTFDDSLKIAEWFKPTFVLKKDTSVLDKKNQIFTEITFSWWSSFKE